MHKPKLFIGSSREALSIARDVQRELTDSFNVHRWDQDIFELSRTTIETLDKACSGFDGAILVFAHEDAVKLRGKIQYSTRDNVVLELGLFMGRLGRSRCVVLMDSGIPKGRLPTDLLGVDVASFIGSGEERTSSIGAACTRIRDHFSRECQPRPLDKERLTLLRDGLELATRAACLPSEPTEIDIRVFLFRATMEELICLEAWSHSPTREDIGILAFNAKEHRDLSVVRAWRTKEPQADAIPKAAQVKLAKVAGVDPDLRFVLAAPIVVERTVWGVVDFDTSTSKGVRVLSAKAARTVAVQLARQIGKVVAASH